MSRSGKRQEGIALVEVLVALLILSMSLAALFQVVADSADRARHIEEVRAARLIAQSQLAAAGTSVPLDSGPVAGNEGPFFWWLSASPYSDGDRSEAGALWSVTVGVRLRSGGPALVVLRSLRVVRAS